MTWEPPPVAVLKAMNREDFTKLWGEAVRKIADWPDPGAFQVGDEVRVIFDSSQACLGWEGVIEKIDPADQIYRYWVSFEEDRTTWVTAVEPLHPNITVPELNTMEEADRFLDSITKER